MFDFLKRRKLLQLLFCFYRGFERQEALALCTCETSKLDMNQPTPL